ncbi:hypothetical protein M5X00_13175 [Paenibacillus alvei]|uniref:hypothetical protein n=1 Tax=Paenibacillus alvei TaxID=44250 RepID=UPI000287F6D2|nr:hypothetical protein [Paenibacillus alvei]EJW13793.1 hypothetical protein PAV_109p00230 [Paenibacillus alvei DSM 29]MCY9540525.1 hypothetical protein [Paenibacillus alvei]MCY9708271.1 hypothetical protein [Paenibacillus alvei]MCY9732934.1 hypothetical protein [Paenibacillus alvei]MCY9755192.1 hypothetical protein [Paenibacillus alvei]
MKIIAQEYREVSGPLALKLAEVVRELMKDYEQPIYTVVVHQVIAVGEDRYVVILNILLNDGYE